MNEGDGKLRRRAKAWKGALGVFGGIALVFGLIFWDAHRRATAVFERHAKEVAGKIAAIRAKDASRSPLFEPPLPGNGWEHYTRAIDVLGSLPEAEAKEIPELRPNLDETVNPAALEALLVKYRPQIEELRKLARATEFRPDFPYENPNRTWPNIEKAIRTSNSLAGLADHLHQTGRGAEALEIIVLGLLMAQDTALDVPLVIDLLEIACEQILIDKVKSMLSESTFAVEDLDRFASLLDRLEKARPAIAEALSAEDIYLRTVILDPEFYEEARGGRRVWGYPPSATWRHLFSKSILRAEGLNDVARYMREAVSIGRLPVRARFAAATRLSADLVKAGEVCRMTVVSVGRVYDREAAIQGRWTLMRVAAAIARFQAEQGRDPAKIEDLVPRYLPRAPVCPYSGEPLRWAAPKLWSIGSDGDDDGGETDHYEDFDSSKPYGDVVWTVKRR